MPRTPATAPDGRPHRESSLIHAINETLKDLFRENPDTFIWGQDVASGEKGGIFNVTKGMEKEFGSHRVFNAPIAEDYILGMADGFSRVCDGVRVIVEGAEFADYFWPAAEQMVEMSHEYWRTNGQFVPNVTVRLASGGYIGGGLYHSQNIEGWLTTLPGIRVVVPAFADDAAGLLRTAVRSRGITLYLEPKFLYNSPLAKTFVPDGFAVPFGKARLRRPGKDLTILAYGTPVHFALEAAETLAKEGKEVEVIDLRSPRPARLRRHRRLGEEDVPRPHRPRGQGVRRLRRRAGGPGDERALRVPRRPGRAGRLDVHAGRLQPDPGAGDPARAPRRCSRRRGSSSPTDPLPAPAGRGPPPQEAGRSYHRSMLPGPKGSSGHSPGGVHGRAVSGAFALAALLGLLAPASGRSRARPGPPSRPRDARQLGSRAGAPAEHRPGDRPDARRLPLDRDAGRARPLRRHPVHPLRPPARRRSSPRAPSSPSSPTRTARSGSGRTAADSCG